MVIFAGMIFSSRKIYWIMPQCSDFKTVQFSLWQNVVVCHGRCCGWDCLEIVLLRCWRCSCFYSLTSLTLPHCLSADNFKPKTFSQLIWKSLHPDNWQIFYTFNSFIQQSVYSEQFYLNSWKHVWESHLLITPWENVKCMKCQPRPLHRVRGVLKSGQRSNSTISTIFMPRCNFSRHGAYRLKLW